MTEPEVFLMTEPDISLGDLHAAYENEFGKFDHVIEFRRGEPDPTVPTELDVLIFMPDTGPNDDDVTLVATAGMSRRTMNGPYERVEFGLEIKGALDEEGRQKVAKQLAELAMVPFRQGEHVEPNTVLQGLKLYPFDKMNYLLLVHWDFLSEVFLPGVSPPVLLLRLIPLYESEAKLVEEIGAIRALTRFRQKGVVFEDFERGPSV